MMRMMNNRTFWRSKRFFIRVSFRSCYCCGFRYRTGSICARIRLDSSANPPNGSWGMVKVQPTKASPCPNPPNGSWGMVKVQPQSPNAVGRRPGFNDPPTAVGGIQEKTVCRCRSDFNHPPTAVGGIQEKTVCRCRSDFNHPPTAVGGIQEKTVCRCRSDFNHPPTAVGWIHEKTVCRCRSDFNHPPTAVVGIQPTLFNPYPGAHARGTVSEALKVYLPIVSCLCANSRISCG